MGDLHTLTSKLVTATDSVTAAPMDVFAVRSGFDRRYFGCFVLGVPHLYWHAVMDDFGSLVVVPR